MNKKQLLALIAKKEARKKEIGKRAETTEDVKELRSINTELASLNEEIAELRSIADSVDDDDEEDEGNREARSAEGSNGEKRGGSPVGKTSVFASYGLGGGTGVTDEQKRQKDMQKQFEQRGADLKAKKSVEFSIEEMPELRATTIGGGTLITETKYGRDLNPTFAQVSRVIDTVNSFPLMGGNSYEQGFEKSIGEGDYTTETADYTNTDPEFDYVTIGKAKITAYAEISDEATHLPNVDYQSKVRQSIVNAIRKKISKQILVGAGGANAITGIFNAPANVIPTSTDLEIAEIDADTLDNIVINYGGDEEVEGVAYLVLNKKDLAAFAGVRDANGRKLYKIKTNGSTGTISSDESFEVPFIINSVCPALSSAATASDTYCMTYGMMTAYEMPIFSPVTVDESRDYKFKSGQVAYRGVVWCGGNVAMYKGFTRIKKA